MSKFDPNYNITFLFKVSQYLRSTKKAGCQIVKEKINMT